MPGHRSVRILRRPNLAQSDILMSRCRATQRSPAGENGPYRALELNSCSLRRVMEKGLPILWDSACRARNGLMFRVPTGRQQPDSTKNLSSHVVVEPSLKRLEARHDWMPGFRGVLCSMLARRQVTTSDVPTLGTPTQMQPPAACYETLFAAVSTRLRVWIDTAGKSSHGGQPLQ